MSISTINARTIGYTSVLGASSLSGTSSASTSGGSPSGVASTRDQYRGDFAALLDAVQAGDMNSAQSALSTLESDMQASSGGYSPAASGASATSSTDPRQNDLDALFQAVKTGDLSSAQTALANLQSDVQTAQTAPASGQAAQGHHHHHHHGGGLKSAIDQAFASIQSSSSDDGTSTVGGSAS